MLKWQNKLKCPPFDYAARAKADGTMIGGGGRDKAARSPPRGAGESDAAIQDYSHLKIDIIFTEQKDKEAGKI